MQLNRRGVFGVLASLFAWAVAPRAAEAAPPPVPPDDGPDSVAAATVVSEDGRVFARVSAVNGGVSVVMQPAGPCPLPEWLVYVTFTKQGLPIVHVGDRDVAADLVVRPEGLRLWVPGPDSENDIRVMVRDIPGLLADLEEAKGQDSRVRRGGGFDA
jgi:hypothetical protein